MKKALVFTLLIVQVLFANFITTSASESSWMNTYGYPPILGTPAPSSSVPGANPSGDSHQIKKHSRHRRGHNKGKNPNPYSQKPSQNPRNFRPNFPQGNH